MEIIRGTTPTIQITIQDEIDLEQVAQVWVYFSQRNEVKVSKDLSDVTFDLSRQMIIVKLEQEDTLALDADKATLFQIRLLLTDGTALGMEASDVKVYQIYKDGVITPEE